MFTLESLANIREFMQRASLTGREVPAFVTALNEIGREEQIIRAMLQAKQDAQAATDAQVATEADKPPVPEPTPVSE